MYLKQFANRRNKNKISLSTYIFYFNYREEGFVVFANPFYLRTSPRRHIFIFILYHHTSISSFQTPNKCFHKLLHNETVSTAL